MSDLTAFRDHARAMANWKPAPAPTARQITALERRNRLLAALGEPPEPLPAPEPGPTDGERALWARLADEVDAYLTGDPDTAGLPVIDDDQLNLLGDNP